MRNRCRINSADGNPCNGARGEICRARLFSYFLFVLFVRRAGYEQHSMQRGHHVVPVSALMSVPYEHRGELPTLVVGQPRWP